MVDYVKGSDHDNWHWCKNCTQYPMFIHAKMSRPPSDPSHTSALNAKKKKKSKSA
jgi:hypothetical protein